MIFHLDALDSFAGMSKDDVRSYCTKLAEFENKFRAHVQDAWSAYNNKLYESWTVDAVRAPSGGVKYKEPQRNLSMDEFLALLND